jgi:2-dehydropantoate 2-reductase
MKFLFFGAGAIGTYIGGSLALAGHNVSFIERPEPAAQIQSRGLRLTIRKQTHLVSPAHVYTSADEALREEATDLMVFALKSFDTESAVAALLPQKGRLPAALCLQNGVENESVLEKAFGTGQVIAGTVTSAVGRGDAGEIRLERDRGVGLAGGHPLSKPVADAFRNAGMQTTIFADAGSMKWSKMLTNLLANASSAILDMMPADVYSDPRLFRMEREMLCECLRVMRASGMRVVDLPGTPVSLLANGVQYLPAFLAQPLLRQVVGGGRGGKLPSFAIDLASGRGITEVRWLNGAVARFGSLVKVSTPVNQTLTEILESLAVGTRDRSEFTRHPEALLARLANASPRN